MTVAGAELGVLADAHSALLLQLCHHLSLVLNLGAGRCPLCPAAAATVFPLRFGAFLEAQVNPSSQCSFVRM